MARQKTVFADSSEVFHLWAHRSQDSARYAKGNVYFEGAALYSYGSHYLCGFMIGDSVAFLNSDSYSVTTSKHQRMAWRATSHLTQHSVPSLTALRDVLLVADSGQSAAAIRRKAARFRKASAEGNAGAINYDGASEERARKLFAAWLADNWQAARDSEGAAFIAKRIGMTDSEVASAISEGERKAQAREAATAKRERERQDSEGKRIAALSLESFRAEWPEDGRDYYGRRDSKPYALKRMEDYGRKLSRLHKRAKAAGYMRRAAALWSHVKAYREHVSGRNDRIIAAHRRERARELMAWRRGEGKRPNSYSFSAESFPAIHARLERAEREERAAAHSLAFADWRKGEAKRPPLDYFAEGTQEHAAIAADIAEERQRNESAYLAWKSDPAAPRPPANFFLGSDYSPNTFKASDGADYSCYTMPDAIKAEYLAAYPFAEAWQELREVEEADKRERERREVEERERERLAAFRERGVVAYPHLSDEKGGALLTVTGGELVTSWGARVPLADAIRVFRFAKLCRETGKAWHANGRRVYCGHYQIDKIMPDGGFKAGCHLIHWPEIERAAILANVANLPADDSAVVEHA
ncbi:MAG: hypothetical protein E6Q97_37940 [Desulfurellales bacterium]|nr:MAG: hypothetical protein E6Q97_37940 [Desulfurellales bacterium]